MQHFAKKKCKNACFLLTNDSLALADERQAIAQWQDDLFHTTVVDEDVVEGLDAPGLWVAVVGMVDDMAVPQGVVGNDEAPRAQDGEHHLVGLCVGALVAIDECHVEGDAQARCLADGVANDERHLVGNRRPLYPRTCEVLLFVVDLEGVQVAVVLQSLRHAEGRIATERTHLEDVLGTNHLYQHLQQAALQMA